MAYCEDWDFATHLLTKHNLAILPQRLLWYNYSTTSLSFTKKSTEKEKYYLEYVKTLEDLYPKSLYVNLFKVYIKHFLIGRK